MEREEREEARLRRQEEEIQNIYEANTDESVDDEAYDPRDDL